jgi:hypothetical protein
MRLAKADVMVSETCTTCHNSHPDSPKRDWKVGDVRGALAVSIPIGGMESQIVGRFGTAALLLARASRSGRHCSTGSRAV